MRFSGLLLLGLSWPLCAPAAAWAPDLISLAEIPAVELTTAMAAKTQPAPDKNGPRQFALRLPVSLGMADGRWDLDSEGRARWRLRLHSPGAHSLHLQLAGLSLPQDAELRVYASDGRSVQGPLRAADVSPEGQLGTPLIMGDSTVLELTVRADQKPRVRLSLPRVFHGYADFRDGAKAAPGGGAAGACERDVACSEGAAWSRQASAVVGLVYGEFFCSGQLLNNVRLDNTPFLLTARHCGIGSSEASNLVTYFNFQRPRCGGGTGSTSQTVSGATLRRSDVSSDMTLLVLRSTPPASYNAYLSGWDASGTGVSFGAGLHHPQGEEKSISLFCQPALKQDGACAAGIPPDQCTLPVDGWEVRWTSGATEQGSSGSGLWDHHQRLVGTLSGGSSDCLGTVGNGEPDIYGRLEVAWGSGGFRQELDPDNTGRLALNGMRVGGSLDGDVTLNAFSCAAPASAPPASSGGGTLSRDVLGALALLAILTTRRRRYR